MIVKNESQIIERLLKSVLPYIDEYLICDTGSTDNTKELIHQFFEKNRISGQIIDEPFRDFGYNRTVALKACDTMEADYILLLDADMIFWVNPEITPTQFRKMLAPTTPDTINAFHILQGTDTFHYKNMRIVKNRANFSYWGVTHEYINCPTDTVTTTIDKGAVFINDIGDGGAKQDKFLRDIRLLKQGLKELPNNDRYTFYLANTLKDSDHLDEAIEMYKNRIAIGGWIEEIWFSAYSIGNCYQRKGDMPMAVHWWLEAYNKYSNRIENLYKIVQHYRVQGNNNLTYTFYMLADYERKKNTNWTDYLFLERDIYDFKLDYEMTIFGYYCNRDGHDLSKLCMKVLGFYGGEEGVYRNVLSNYKFYTAALMEVADPFLNAKLLETVGKTIVVDPAFYQSTPSICLHNSKLIVCQRYVNYRIDDNGGYVNKDQIETRNIIAIINIDSLEWQIINEFEMNYDKSLDDRYVGIEDVRIISAPCKTNSLFGYNALMFNGNRGLKDGTMRVEHGIISTESDFSGLIKYDKSTNIEKNWVLFTGATGKMNCVYGWNPLTIGTVADSDNNSPDYKFNLVDVVKMDMPNVFNYVRGSTNGVIIDDEVWFITHVVSYEDRRWYYHMVVILDLATMRLKRYSRLFTFEKKPVEYTLGFVYMKDTKQFLIGYSILDRETKYILVAKSKIDELLIQ